MVPEIEFSAEAITLIAAAVVALFFAYFPGVRVKFAGLAPEVKSLIMIGLLLIITAAVVTLGCTGVFVVVGLICGKAGITQWVVLFVMAVIANQGIHRIFPEMKDVTQARANRYAGTLLERIPF